MSITKIARRTVIVLATLSSFAIAAGGAAGAAQADTAPPSIYSTHVDFTVPSKAAPAASDFPVHGTFWGLKLGEAASAYGVVISCDDGFGVIAKIAANGGRSGDDGSYGADISASLPLSELGESCHADSYAPAGKQLGLDQGHWWSAMPEDDHYLREFSLSAHVITVAPTRRGGLY